MAFSEPGDGPAGGACAPSDSITTIATLVTGWPAEKLIRLACEIVLARGGVIAHVPNDYRVEAENLPERGGALLIPKDAPQDGKWPCRVVGLDETWVREIATCLLILVRSRG